jgi:hypothetical protein
MRRLSLPRLDIPVACTADWNQMRAIDSDGRARHCAACDRPVYDTRSLTRGDLARLIEKHEGTLPCLRLHRRPDGTVVTRSCFAPVARAGRFLWLEVGLAAAAFWATVVGSGWARRPAPSLVQSEATEAEAQGTRKIPFVLKPPAEVEGPPRRRVTRKARDTSRIATWTLGRPTRGKVPE